MNYCHFCIFIIITNFLNYGKYKEHRGTKCPYPPLKSIVVNGKKKIAVNGVVNINASSKGGVQPDWNQNDATKPDYIKNRPFYEEVTPLFPDTAFKFNEQGSMPSIVLETDEPVLVDGDTVEFTSLNPEIEVRYNSGVFSPDGKSGSFGFSIYDLNGQSQGGGGGSINFDGVTGKYLFAISGSGNPNVVANLEFTMTRQHEEKINADFIAINSTLQRTDGLLGIPSRDALYASTSDFSFSFEKYSADYTYYMTMSVDVTLLRGAAGVKYGTGYLDFNLYMQGRNPSPVFSGQNYLGTLTVPSTIPSDLRNRLYYLDGITTVVAKSDYIKIQRGTAVDGRLTLRFDYYVVSSSSMSAETSAYYKFRFPF